MLPLLQTSIPGPRSAELAARLAKVESPNITFLSDSFPIFWERAEGTNVWDVDGNRYLDLTSAFAVSGLGHRAPVIVEALKNQADALIHGMGDVHPTELKVRLCEKLSEITFERWGAGTGKTILVNSGFEAVEAALKTAFLHTKRPGVLAFEGGYHGLGFGALDTCGITFFQNPFRAQLAGFTRHVPFPKQGDDWDPTQTETLLRQHPVGCILVEPIQGRGGDIVPPDHFLPTLRSLCDREGILLIFDEIYTGFNRTGELFAAEQSQTIPDLICLGKGMSSGFPISACVGKTEVMNCWPVSRGEALHTSTFLGHPLGCRMALASIEQHLQPNVLPQVRAAGDRFRRSLSELSAFPCLKEVRGAGLMIGLELVDALGCPNGTLSGKTVVECLASGIIVLGGGPAGNVLSLAPPFGIDDEEIEFFVRTLASIWQQP